MTEISTIKGLEQGRAKFAYDKVFNEVVKKKVKKDKEYKSYVRKIPALIKTNGLGETFAFINAKKTTDEEKSGYAYYLIYAHTTQWLKAKKLLPNEDLIGWIISLDSAEYRIATNEVLSFFKWLSRFAEGMIEGDIDDE